MDSVSFARLPRIKAENVSYIAVASSIVETNTRLDLMNSLISENTARCLQIVQNEERVQHLARQKNNHASYRPISQTVFMLSIAINRAEHVCATVIIKHNYMLMCNHEIVANIMLCLLNSTGHI